MKKIHETLSLQCVYICKTLKINFFIEMGRIIMFMCVYLLGRQFVKQ